IRPIDDWRKLKLLLWKNAVIQWNQKMQVVLGIVLPWMFMVLVLTLRILIQAQERPQLRYQPLAINNLRLYHQSFPRGNQILHQNGSLNIPKLVLCYTPKKAIYTTIVKQVVSSLQLMSLRPYATGREMQVDMVEHNFFAGLEFDDKPLEMNEKGYPRIFNYTIRFPSELRTMTGPTIETWLTDSRFQRFDARGARNWNDSDGGAPVGYLREGFLPVQHAVTMAWLNLATGNKVAELPPIWMQRFPYHSFMSDPFLVGMYNLLPLLLLLCFVYPSTVVAKLVTSEKELQLKEILRLMGVHNWLQWVAWFVKSYALLMLVVASLMCTLFIKFSGCCGIITYSQWFPVLMFLHAYAVSAISLCFLISVIFSKASTSAAVTAILWIITYIPFTISVHYPDYLGLTWQLLLCMLFCNVSLGYGFRCIIEWEGTGTGITMETMFKPASIDKDITLFHINMMLTLNAVLTMLICVYVEQVRPGEFGVPRKWYFCLRRNFCCPRNGLRERASSTVQRILEKEGGTRRPKEIGVRLINLDKSFGHHRAVRSLNLKMYRNEITVLLGHNGAGKTTTINMLTGITQPSHGTAFLNGYDIRTEMSMARQSLGICPQKNILFSHLSVRDHIVFFCKLKGVHGRSTVKDEVTKYIGILGLERKSHTESQNLSGGMKRKLALCCALCGETKIVLCDEPSSGIDAAGRRSLWELLQAEKKGRTVLLTTHYMDEADVLGDRIAILSDGQLQCCGTSFQLKKLYGPGYQLVCIMQPGCDVATLTMLVKRHVPDTHLERQLGSELTYRLPNRYSKRFAPLLKDLEDYSAELKLNGYGLSVASLEDVFMRVSSSGRLPGGAEMTDKKGFTNLIFDMRTRDPRRSARCGMLWQGLLMKKAYMTVRFFWIVLVIVILPIVVISLAILNSVGSSTYFQQPPLFISLEGYKTGYSVLEDKATGKMAGISEAYGQFVKSFGPKFHFLKINKPFESYVLDKPETDHYQIYYQHLTAATITNTNMTVWLNNKLLHTAPMTLNVLHNAIARHYLGDKAFTGVTNKPLPYSRHTMSMRMNKATRLGFEVALHVSLTMCPVVSFFAIPIIKERETRAKLLQFLSGVDVVAYWLSMYIWDYLMFTLSAFSGICCLAAYQKQGYIHLVDLWNNLAVMLVFGFAALPVTYVMAGFFSDSATGFTRIAIVHTLTGPAIFIVWVVLGIEIFDMKEVANSLGWYFRIFPHFALASAIHQIHIGFNIRRACNTGSIGSMPRSLRCNKLPICCNIPGYFAWEKPGVLPDIVYMSVEAVVLILVLFIRDAKLHYFLNDHLRKSVKYASKKAKRKYFLEDTDVNYERIYVSKLKSSERQRIPLLVENLSKRFGRRFVVKNITFHVSQGECFGLLGINGAGKTTTFKMLTGDETITAGNAFIEGISLSSHWYKVYGRIGYCPQFDALFDDLTGKQTLFIYCLLRGVQRKYVTTISWALAIAFGFQQHMNKPVKFYSGGNKRKLSVAIAIIGSPSVLFLDEPTSGMDPGARSHLWKMISMIRLAGKSIVLTSHSMDECETLCTRLAIMVNGQFKCIGSVQGLKNAYSKGLILKIKVNQRRKQLSRVIESSSSDIDKPELQGFDSRSYTEDVSFNYQNTLRLEKDTGVESRIRNIIAFIMYWIPDAEFKEECNGLLTFYIPHVRLLPEIFHLVESNMQQMHIEDYLIAQTRLEEIFLEFALNRDAEETGPKR
ncbi:hypothetical protein KR018_009186, partial [Drosophila ironensis]